MLHIDNYHYATDLNDAYNVLQSDPKSVVLGGCGYLRLGGRRIKTAIDLSRLNLSDIVEQDSDIEFGAMTSLRDVETNTITANYWNGMLQNAVKKIVGVQLRSSVTLGGSVAGRYPFSDPISALLALDAQLLFHHSGLVSLKTHLECDTLRDILVKIIVPKDARRAAFTSICKSATDYAILNVAVALRDNEYRVVVGSRPGRATLVPEVAEFLKSEGLNERSAVEAGKIAADNIQFGDNPRGSSEYRKAICPVLIKRALLEVLHAA